MRWHRAARSGASAFSCSVPTSLAGLRERLIRDGATEVRDVAIYETRAQTLCRRCCSTPSMLAR